MKKIVVDKEFFNIADTLSCGQVFRFIPYKKGFKVFSLDKCAYCYEEGNKSVIYCKDSDEEYFYNYFDLGRDYSVIFNSALKEDCEILKTSANLGKGVRILNQDSVETLFSFMISQNNNIPRIKGIIERLCAKFGEIKDFEGEKYYAFPTVKNLAKVPLEIFCSIGLGYRAPYIKRLATEMEKGKDIYALKGLETKQLKKQLLSIYGVGPKVADCVLFFGFRKTDSFPVDTWIEKVYRENFNGTVTDRVKIADYFVNRFKDYSGYYQQYLFYYKRSLEK